MKLFEVSEDAEEDNLYMVLEFMDLGGIGGKGHMKHLGISGNTLPDNLLRKYFRDCILGLDYRTLPMTSA